MKKFDEYDCVQSLVQIGKVPKGATGTIVDVYTDEDFMVEFTKGLFSYGTFTVKASQIVPWEPKKTQV